MVESQLKCLCYNCDENNFLGHKCKAKNIFMAKLEYFFEEGAYSSLVPEIPPLVDLNTPYDPQEVEPLISMNALTGFFAP
jgi:hypothetical protein